MGKTLAMATFDELGHQPSHHPANIWQLRLITSGTVTAYEGDDPTTAVRRIDAAPTGNCPASVN